MIKLTGDWENIEGEIITLPNPEKNLPPIDRLEGYNPINVNQTFYCRSLITAKTQITYTPVWLYWMKQVTEGFRIGKSWNS